MTEDWTPTQVRFFWTRGTGRVSCKIARITAPWQLIVTRRTWDVPSHMGIIVADENGVGVYGEAHFETDWQYNKPLAALLAERDSDSRRRLWISDRLPIPVDAVPAIHKRGQDMVGRWTYSTHQIWHMWLWRRFGLPIKDTPNAVVCSEAASRMVAPWYDLPRRCGVRNHEYVIPSWSYIALGMPEPFTGYWIGR